MACDSPYYVLPYKGATEKVPVPCGRCPICKRNRVNQWAFRLQQEDKVSLSAHFVTLTYDSNHVPISDNGFLTLRKKDLQDYWKRLRKLVPDATVKYFAVGEYGSKNKRPHYHAIVFNVSDDKLFFDAWSLAGVPFGDVHVGTVTSDSIAYTLKYIDKSNFRVQHRRDDRQPEFSLMSKGLGDSYLSDQIVRYHKANPGIMAVTKLSGHKVPIPRYYRNKIFSESERKAQLPLIQLAADKAEAANRYEWSIQYSNRMTYEEYVDSQRHGRYVRFYSNQKDRSL